MHLPLEINFGQVPPLPAIKSAVRAGAAGLNRYCPDIIGCHVDLSAGGAGSAAQVHVRLTLPGSVMDVNHPQDTHEDLESAIHCAFAAMQLRLADWLAGQHVDAVAPR